MVRAKIQNYILYYSGCEANTISIIFNLQRNFIWEFLVFLTYTVYFNTILK